MKSILEKFHDPGFIEKRLKEIEDLTYEIYGRERGRKFYEYLVSRTGSYLESLDDETIEKYRKFNPEDPYRELKGKIFAICYPDNVYDDLDPTLKTLGEFLSEYFPHVNGIHILPERVMSHPDVWAQDLHAFHSPEKSLEIINALKADGILDKKGYITSLFPGAEKKIAAEWGEGPAGICRKAYDSHFNDGGFSQINRQVVDRRFGTSAELNALTGRFAVMLDFVVNHLDVDNEVLKAYRNGSGDGDAFIIISPEEYREMKLNGSLYKTFRPRPFPLFTGMRKLPSGGVVMGEKFKNAGLSPMDGRVSDFLSIFFKIENDQGLSAEDKRIFRGFTEWLSEKGIDPGEIFRESEIQSEQKIFNPDIAGSMDALLALTGFSSDYGRIFIENEEEVYGEKFYIYTTFSESQVDINPVSFNGFRMVIDDLFTLMSGGRIAMMRMDAIKYLWKEKGRKNFDMPEGNRLIELMRKLMGLAAPGVLPLDEINSPDPVVYGMSSGGAFAYLFGPVNSTVAAFNSGNLAPLTRFNRLYRESSPDNFVPFVMLSTHDGRSVQGLGVQRTDGHVSIEGFYSLKSVIEKQGGKTKYRSVPRGEIEKDTFDKVIEEAGFSICRNELMELFTKESRDKSNILTLRNPDAAREDLLKELSIISDRSISELEMIPAVDYFLEWICGGRTVYELCSTSRSSFLPPSNAGLSPAEEAGRFALAQMYILTCGQGVPAVYFNDLLGVENDLEGFHTTGRPRDLNRHKTDLSGFDISGSSDPFRAVYINLVNRIIKIRTEDPAFYPGSSDFEYIPLTDSVFLNHAYYKGEHSFILGNISAEEARAVLNLKQVESIQDYGEVTFMDLISGSSSASKEGVLNLDFEPFGMKWLKISPK